MTELERRRLTALHSYRVLDTEPEAAFDRITDLAADLFDAPIALVSLIDESRQWFKSRHGLGACATPREQAFCAHALELEPHAVMVVEDASADPRFADNPLVTGAPHIRFYAGALLTDAEGHALGTLCVIDTAPRPRPAEADLARLKMLAKIVVDSLQRLRADRLISEQRRLLSMVEHMSGVGHWRYAVRTGRVTWSDEVYRIHGLGRRRFDPSYEGWLSLFHDEDLPILHGLLLGAIRDHAGYEFELRIKRADGEVREVASKATVEVDERGEVVAVFGVIQDVTDRNRALREVVRGEARYKLLADNMADVVTRIRLDGGSSYISPAVETLIGYTPAEMNGRPAQDFVYAPDQPQILETFAALAAGQDEATVQLRATHRDGHPVWVETRFRLLRDANGQPAEMVAVIRDIEDRKRLEAELTLAREAAETAAEVKSQFLANMSHELRTPLTSIIGFTGLAGGQRDLKGLARDYVLRVENASKALLCTVNDILDFSKLEAGHVTLKPEPTDAAELCRSTLELLTPQAAAKDLRLALSLDMSRGVTLLLDPDRVRQVLLNLVGNAVKFTPGGQVTVDIAYASDEQHLRIAVADTGPGIAADQMGKLFQRFSQIDGSVTRAHGGTGLGLAICKGLVEAMGGEIGAESVPGRGSRFWFSIPAPLCRAGAPGVRRVGPVSLGVEGARVLIADDHPANRELARLFLTGCGAEVTEADDGQAAVALAADRPFDAILMDVRMPRLDGVGALQLIQSMPGPNAETPIIAYTADASPDEIARLMAQGFDSVVVKPVDASQLITAVAQAAALAPVRQAALRLQVAH